MMLFALHINEGEGVVVNAAIDAAIHSLLTCPAMRKLPACIHLRPDRAFLHTIRKQRTEVGETESSKLRTVNNKKPPEGGFFIFTDANSVGCQKRLARDEVHWLV